jgi:hypothetical protein
MTTTMALVQREPAQQIGAMVFRWMKHFMTDIRRPTRQAQKLSGNLEIMKNDFVKGINERLSFGGTLADVEPTYFLNMDETPLPFEPATHTTISNRGDRTVSARKASSTGTRASVCLAVTSDGQKLPPFVVFKGVPGARIESNLPSITPAGIYATCQRKAWMDQDTTEMWVKSVSKPHVEGQSASLLLWDDFSTHKTSAIRHSLADVGSEIEIIPGNNIHYSVTSKQKYCD